MVTIFSDYFLSVNCLEKDRINCNSSKFKIFTKQCGLGGPQFGGTYRKLKTLGKHRLKYSTCTNFSIYVEINKFLI